MEGILSTFGIDWRLLAIQAFNFALLMFGLWYFLYGPLMKTLEERRRKVAQGVVDAQRAQQKLKEVESERATKLADAGREADQIISHARASGNARERDMLQHAEVAAASVLQEAEAQAKEMKDRAILESKEEVAKMIVLGMEKV